MLFKCTRVRAAVALARGRARLQFFHLFDLEDLDGREQLDRLGP